MKQSENLDALAAAFSKAQATVEGARRDSNNPHFKSKYADLASVWLACREALTSNGLSVVQGCGEVVDGKLHMTTRLLHASGQWLEDTLSLPLGKMDAQGYGSAVTYARRYALAAMVGVSPEDDDGNAASQPVPRQAANAPAGPVSDKQRQELETLADEVGADKRKLCEYLQVESLGKLPASQFEEAKQVIERKRRQAA